MPGALDPRYAAAAFPVDAIRHFAARKLRLTLNSGKASLAKQLCFLDLLLTPTYRADDVLELHGAEDVGTDLVLLR